MQSERTIQFWNKYYIDWQEKEQPQEHFLAGNNTESIASTQDSLDERDPYDCSSSTFTAGKEWILRPSKELFDVILSHSRATTATTSAAKNLLINNISCHNTRNGSSVIEDTENVYRILEIGCGNSHLAIEFWKYLMQLQQQQQQPSQIQHHTKDSQYSQQLNLPQQPKDDSPNRNSSCSSNDHKSTLTVTNTATTNTDIYIVRKKIQFWATDVSEVCIAQITQRDYDRVTCMEHNNNNKHSKSCAVGLYDNNEIKNHENGDNAKKDNENCSCHNNSDQYFQYRVLNVTEPHPELINTFDLILDKGCLDTFLFRSKNRGSGNINSCYAALIQTVLDNIQSWLKNDRRIVPNSLSSNHSNMHSNTNGDSDSDRTSTLDSGSRSSSSSSDGGVYLLFSPRSKHRSLRDYRGFATVHREELDLTKLYPGSLEGSRVIDKSTNRNNKKVKKSNPNNDPSLSSKVMGSVYLYACTKNNQYSKTQISSLPTMNSSRTPTSTTSTTSTTASLSLSSFTISDKLDCCAPDDDETCPKCGITFYKYRNNGESLVGRGKPYWIRRWKGHCTHCCE